MSDEIFWRQQKGAKAFLFLLLWIRREEGDETRTHALNINWTFFNFHPFPFKSGAKNALNRNGTFTLHPLKSGVKNLHVEAKNNICTFWPTLALASYIPFYDINVNIVIYINIKSNPWYQLLWWLWGVGLYWRKKRHYDLDPLSILMLFNQQSLSMLSCWP